MSDSCFELEGWDEFVERFSQFVDKKPRLERLIESFMEQTAREIEGGRL